jgi:hypothetical protein
MRRYINQRLAEKLGLDEREINILSELYSPERIQDYLEQMPNNFEKNGNTCRSPRVVMRENMAHCLEGSLLAGLALWLHGEKPLIMDLKSGKGDDDHVVTLFKRDGLWGAISKTNHVVLRYRDPVFKNVRELAISYFNEYFLDDGRKTLRAYSDPFNLALLPDTKWVTTEQNLWSISRALDRSPHHLLVKKEHIGKLRPADLIERKAGKLTRWRK